MAFERPATLVEVAEAAKAGDEPYRIALAGFLDDFYMNPKRRQTMIDVEPPITGFALTDAYLGAVGEHLARRWGLVIPRWTADPRRTLHSPFFAGGIEALKAMLLVQSPLAFRKRMIFVEHEPLRRARMPRESEPDGCLPSPPARRFCGGIALAEVEQGSQGRAARAASSSKPA